MSIRKRNHYKIISKLCLFDDDFAKVVFKDCECVEYVLNIVLGKKVKVIESDIQYIITNLKRRSIQLDIFARDEDDIYYNIEIQRDKENASVLRARYHMSLIDSEVSYTLQRWKDIKELYIIFITECDMFGMNKPIYHYDRVLRDENIFLDSKEHIMYINGKNKDYTDLGRLMYDFGCVDADMMTDSVLKRRVKLLKEESEVENEMCELIDEYVRRLAKEDAIEYAKEIAQDMAKDMAKDMAQDIAKSQIEEHFRNVIKRMNDAGIDVDKIAEFMSISKSEVLNLI